ncbi:unnamed protein product [Cochlearia groenlandica]
MNKNQFRSFRGGSSNLAEGGRAEAQKRSSLQRQLLPEFTATLEDKAETERQREGHNRYLTKNWVITAFGKAGKEGVVIDEEKLKQMIVGGNVEARRDNSPPEKEQVAEGKNGSGRNHEQTTGEPMGRRCLKKIATEEVTVNNSQKVEVPTPKVTVRPRSIIVEAINKLHINKDNVVQRPNGPKSGNALTNAGPIGVPSPPLSKSWYEETVEEEELERRVELLNQEVYEIPIEVEPIKSSGKKRKGFKGALSVKKKIVNTLASNGKMIKTSRLTMNDYALVANTRPSKMSPDKDKKHKTLNALVGGDLPVNK